MLPQRPRLAVDSNRVRHRFCAFAAFDQPLKVALKHDADSGRIEAPVISAALAVCAEAKLEMARPSN
jgi:hypothetical protein